MIKRFFVLLLAAAALGGGVYVLKARKSPEQKPTDTSLPGLDASTSALRPASQPARNVAPPVAEIDPNPEPADAAAPYTFVSSRIAILFVIAFIFGGLSYVGLGESPSAIANLDFNGASMSMTASVPGADRADVTQLKTAARTSELAGEQAATPQPTPTQAAPPPAAPTPAVAAEAAVVPVETPTPEPLAQPATVFQAPADGIEAIICALPWPCEEALAVARCESGTDMNGRLDGNWATNGIHYGLFQISAIHADRFPNFYDSWMDPATNAGWAYQMWSESGWGPWQCKPWF